LLRVIVKLALEDLSAERDHKAAVKRKDKVKKDSDEVKKTVRRLVIGAQERRANKIRLQHTLFKHLGGSCEFRRLCEGHNSTSL
jgi:hypothetical protein